jgi:hypothetical protein
MCLTHPLRSFTNGAAGEEFLTPCFSLPVVEWDTSNDIGIFNSWKHQVLLHSFSFVSKGYKFIAFIHEMLSL